MKLSAKLAEIGYFMEFLWAVYCFMSLFVQFGFGYKNIARK